MSTQLESGIIVPDTVAAEVKADAEAKAEAERVRVVERWTHDMWKKHYRTFKDYLTRKISITMVCQKCKTQIKLLDTAPNQFVMRCDCTDRLVVRGV